MNASRRNYRSSNKRIGFILLLILTFSIWTLITLFNQWVDSKDIKNELIELQVEEQEALTKKSSLETEVFMLKNHDYIAELARRNYFLSKPGEIIIISPEE